MTAAGSVSQARTADASAAQHESARGRRQTVFIVTVAFGVFLASNVAYPFKRPDYFLLADAFLHGRTWIDATLMPTNVDLIHWGGHVYLPFGPGPAFALMPLVALLGPIQANAWQAPINAAVAAADVALLLLLIRRAEPRARPQDVSWAIALLAFSTPLWLVTVRTGPWHFAQLLAVGATSVAVLELLGRRRAWVIGLSLGFGILARLTLIVAVPFLAWYLVRSKLADRQPPGIRALASLAAPVVVSLALTALYNWLRFASPVESGYGLAALPPFLADLRAQGLFSIAHLPSNLELLLFHLPIAAPAPFFLKPDGFGLTIALAGPGLFLVTTAEWSRPFVKWAAVTGLAVLIPSLLYYGGGWIQLGFRYLLDSLPFIAVLIASAIRRPLAWWWKALIVVGIAVNLWGVAWSYTLWLQ